MKWWRRFWKWVRRRVPAEVVGGGGFSGRRGHKRRLVELRFKMGVKKRG